MDLTYLYILFIFTTLFVMVALVIITYIITKKMNYQKKEIKLDIRPLSDLVDILHFTIEKEITYRLRIEYEIKRSTKIITDYAGELNLLSKAVLNAFAPAFLKELQYYYNEQYILEYIVKMVQIFILKYMDENKIKTK
jgi:hypothetical protein